MATRRIIDLSIALEHDLPSDPDIMRPHIDYSDHTTGAHEMKLFFPHLDTNQLPKGLGWAIEKITLITHTGTHMDAPYHYHPTMNNGQRALTIDEIPLEWCFNDGVLLDFSHKGDGERITAQDVQQELERIEYTIKPMDIVLIRTGADTVWGRPEYLLKGAGMTRESTLFLLRKGVKVVGIDAWSWDRPLPFQAREYEENHDPSMIWEAHFAGIEMGFCHLEKLANMAGIGRSYGFRVCCFPIKIKNASAGWTRTVAIIEES